VGAGERHGGARRAKDFVVRWIAAIIDITERRAQEALRARTTRSRRRPACWSSRTRR
jgi:hypothetical protein